MDPRNLLSFLSEHFFGPEGPSDWPSAAKLRSSDILRFRSHEILMQKLGGQLKVLSSQHKAIRAQMEAANTSIWDVIFSAYNLPREFDYRYDEDRHLILKKPPERKQRNNESLGESHL